MVLEALATLALIPSKSLAGAPGAGAGAGPPSFGIKERLGLCAAGGGKAGDAGEAEDAAAGGLGGGGGGSDAGLEEEAATADFFSFFFEAWGVELKVFFALSAILSSCAFLGEGGEAEGAPERGEETGVETGLRFKGFVTKDPPSTAFMRKLQIIKNNEFILSNK